jgi:serine/threonine-protein kinase
VFVAIDAELNREVALKEILDARADDAVSRQKFLVEAEITGSLEHPGIVPVYGLGTYGDGRPYYAMRFIRGTSLKEAIEKFHAEPALRSDPSRRPLELRKLLRRFLDVCNTLEYAHGRGVLHRDIKPGNIMVGRYGETLVVDWGLAKATGQSSGEESGEEPPVVPSSGSGSVETLPGSALGTPRYMSPEQARGDVQALGPATDVYALGATLYSLLTGKPPFEQNNVGEVLKAVQAGTFVPPRRIDPSIDRALEAVCRKAMALEPADRYASVKALADDVERWLADEPVTARHEPARERLRRWGRRHRTFTAAAAAVLLMSALGLGAVSAVQTKANADLTAANTELERQRSRAEDREQLAIDAVERFRDAVANDAVLKEPALKELRKNLLKEPLSFFRSLRDRLQADGDTRTESLVKLASAAFNLGQLSAEIGDKQDALAAYQESLEIRRKLVDANPTVIEFQNNLSSSHNNIGLLLASTGKTGEALEAHEQALEIRRKLVEANPTVTEFEDRLARTHNNIGVLLSATGKPVEALQAHEMALQILRKLTEANPKVSELQTDLAASLNNIGQLLGAGGKTAEALEAHQEAIEILGKLSEANPTVSEFQSALATSHTNVASLLGKSGNPAEALESLDAGLKIWRRLAEENPTVTEVQSRLAASHYTIGLLLSATGKPAKALESHQAALKIQRALCEANPAVTELQNDLASSHFNIGNLLGATGKTAEALEAYKAALEIRRKLAEANPTITEFQNNLATSHYNIGNLLFANGKPAEALEAYQAALEILRKLTTDHPEVIDAWSALGGTLNNIASFDLNARRFAEAREKLQEAIPAQRTALAALPGNPTFRAFLANHLRNLFDADRELGLVEEAKEIQRQYQELMENDPRFAAVEVRLHAILEGAPPRGNAERLALAQRAYDTGRSATAARLWSEALAAEPALADDRRNFRRYNAARAAALAGCGIGHDQATLDDPARAKLRDQALEWLQAERDAWAKALAGSAAEARAEAVKQLQFWRQDEDLARVRAADLLSKLPEAEQPAWQALWASVDELLQNVSATHPADSAPPPEEKP